MPVESPDNGPGGSITPATAPSPVGKGLAAPQSLSDHFNSDVDQGPFAQHHTLGGGPDQAAPGNHTHSGGSGLAVQRQKFYHLSPAYALVQNAPQGFVMPIVESAGQAIGTAFCTDNGFGAITFSESGYYSVNLDFGSTGWIAADRDTDNFLYFYTVNTASPTSPITVYNYPPRMPSYTNVGDQSSITYWIESGEILQVNIAGHTPAGHTITVGGSVCIQKVADG